MIKSNEVKQLGGMQIILYHLLPGIPIFLLAIFFANPEYGLGMSIMLALMLAALIGLIPFQLLIIKLAANKEGKKFADMILFTNKTARGKFFLFVFGAFVLAGAFFTLVNTIEQSFWINFTLYPDWLRTDKYTIEASNMALLWLTVVMYFVFNGFLGPVVEECYFRGFLLPRMNKLGKLAPLINTVLFSLYHFFSPWQILTRIFGFLPIAYATWYTKNIRLSITVHCLLNLIGCFQIAMLVLQLYS